ncbi:MAG: hypothetical protein J7604_00040 [Sporocytophaga sp.]|uniref:FISUMP domain-containing protein n=1 Tax=Sporocytophaga sp. TaxID=2231183 RepID=UPI001B1AE267|nr:FISUMP domain-containing protein [Sporocytophaga sp.]MBO9698560.1 hypothetical protein [Sporocytophaga sp.]
MKNQMFSFVLPLAMVSILFVSCKKDKDNKPQQSSESTFKDPRDQKIYKLVTIFGQTWFAENLNYEMDGSSSCADDSCDKYGRLYTGPDAKMACPEGYHLPTDEEWRTLEHNLGMSDDDTAKVGVYETRGVSESIGMRLAKGGSSGFNAIILGNGTYFWSSDTQKDYWQYQYMRILHPNDSSVYRTFNGKPEKAKLCVRCLKN